MPRVAEFQPSECILPVLILPLLFAPFIGSFLGVLIRRLPSGAVIVFGRSRCEACGQTLAAGDMVPLLSFPLLKGRCRRCHAPIDWMHFGVELAALGIATISVVAEHYAGGDPQRVWADCILGWALLALGWIDARHMILPDVLTLPLIVLGLAWSFYADPSTMAEHAAGAVVGYAAFRLIAMAYRRMRQLDGLGEGDAKLLAAGGAWDGLTGLGPIILLAGLLGLAWVSLERWRGHDIGLRSRIPFGPCLVAAIWVVYLVS